MGISLREWAKQNKIWEPEAWKVFLKEDLVPFYVQTYTLNALHEFLKGGKVSGRPSLADIEDEVLRNKIRTAIYGGVKSGGDLGESFAKFMYDTFGICAENAPSFEESIKYYESWGDGVKVSIGSNSWVSSIPIRNLVEELSDLIRYFSRRLGIELSGVGIRESYHYSPLEIVEPDALLPQAGEKPEKLVSLINKFRQKALDLSVGVNPFTTFAFYSRMIPLIVLIRFLGMDEDSAGDVEKVAKLADFLGLKAYSMIDQKEAKLPTKSPDKFILLPKGEWSRSGGVYYPSLIERILQLQNYLKKVDPEIKQAYEGMIKEAVGQVHTSFEPWKYYESLFLAIRDIMKDEYGCELLVVKGMIEKVSNGYRPHYRRYREVRLSNKIWLKDFLVRIYPIISAGVISITSFPQGAVSLSFSPFAGEWINKVIENGGKT